MVLPNDDRELRSLRERLQPSTLNLVATYYPPQLKLKVLACCTAQLTGKAAHACRNAFCPACCPGESRRIAKAQYARFEACSPIEKAPRLAHEVYTLPPHLRARLATPEGFGGWKSAVLATIREVHGADVAGVMNLHAHGDEDITKFHPHWDVVINGYVLTPSGRAKEHRPPHIQYDDARRIYARNLALHLGLPPQDEPTSVDLWLDRKYGAFHTNRRKTWHTVRYSARHVYEPHHAWLNDAGTQGDWWYRPGGKKGETYAFEGADVARNLFTIQAVFRQNRRRVWFGYMNPRTFTAAARAIHDGDA